jgi:hypothetical protein
MALRGGSTFNISLNFNGNRSLKAALGDNFEVTIGRTACEACRAKWDLGINPVFALGPGKSTENPVQSYGI